MTEKLALVAHLRRALEYGPYPYAPRLNPLKAILAKVEPPTPQPPKPVAADQGRDEVPPGASKAETLNLKRLAHLR